LCRWSNASPSILACGVRRTYRFDWADDCALKGEISTTSRSLRLGQRHPKTIGLGASSFFATVAAVELKVDIGLP